MKNITKNKFFKSTLCLCLIIALLSRCMVFYLALASNVILGERIAEGFWRLKTPFFNMFAVWDSAYYLAIAKSGYNSDKSWGFFPLYPLILRIFSLPFTLFTNEPLVVGGFFLSNILFIALIVYFYKLTLLLFKNKNITYLSTLFLSISPASVFFSALYSESLFMFLMVASLYYMETGKWKISTFFAILTALTRPIGFLMFIPILYKSFPLLKKNKSIIIHPIITLFSPSIFMLYSYFMTKNPITYINSKVKFWYHNLTDPITSFGYLPIENQIITGPIIIASLLALFYFFKSFYKKKTESYKIPYFLLSISLLIVYLFTGQLTSFPRFTLTLLPIYWVMSEISLKYMPSR